MPVSPTHFISFLCFGLLVGCSPDATRRNSKALYKMPAFSVTNTMVGGELTETIQWTNGVWCYVTRESAFISLKDNARFMVTFNSDSKKPMGIFLELPGPEKGTSQSVFDRNADGVPEMRRFSSSDKTEVFLGGTWLTAHKNESNMNWHVQLDGNEIEPKWTANGWVRVGGEEVP